MNILNEDERTVMNELLFRELNGHTFMPVPRITAIALEQKGWAKVVSEAPPTFRLTEKGKNLLKG